MNKDQILITFYVYYLIVQTHLTPINNHSLILTQAVRCSAGTPRTNRNSPAAVRTGFCTQVRPTFWTGGEFSRQLPTALRAKMVVSVVSLDHSPQRPAGRLPPTNPPNRLDVPQAYAIHFLLYYGSISISYQLANLAANIDF
jgi:hypothetical protein